MFYRFSTPLLALLRWPPAAKDPIQGNGPLQDKGPLQDEEARQANRKVTGRCGGDVRDRVPSINIIPFFVFPPAACCGWLKNGHNFEEFSRRIQ